MGELLEPRGAATPTALPELEPLRDPTVSVVVGTWSDERWADVERVAAAVGAQTRAPLELILVVDCNPALLDRARRTFRDVRCLANANGRGLSGVRNTGAAAATGDVIAFVDDDAEPEQSWLEELVAGYDAPNVLGVGGAIRPRWEDGRPGWFPSEFDWVVGCTYSGLRKDAGPVRNLIGANMSMRRTVIDALGGFRSELSKIGGRSRPEDTDFCLRALTLFPEGTWAYRPSAVVHHRVPAERGRVSYFVARCYHEGRGKAELVTAVGAGAGLESERAYARRTLPRALGRETATALRHADPRAAGRAGAVVLGLGTAALGYLAGAALRASAQRRAVPQPAPLAPGALRILMVCAKYLPLTGGAELHVHEVATRLVRLGHDVTVLTTVADGGLAGVAVEGGVTIMRVRAYGSRFDAYFAPAVWRMVRRPDWDVVHCQGFHTLTGPLTMLAALSARRDYVVTFHRGVHATRLRRVLMGAQIRLLRPLIARATTLISVSGYEAKLFARELRLPLERFEIIPNASRLELPAGEQPGARRTGSLLVSIGRLELYKGHHRIIEALPHVIARQPDVRLRIAGSGPRGAQLRRQAEELGVSDRVTMEPIPPGDPESMARLLLDAAVVVALSDYESQSLVVLEALALRCPTLVQYAGANIEHADARRVRAVSPDTPPADLALAVVDMLEHPFEPAGEPLPDWDDCVARLLALYRDGPSIETGSRPVAALREAT